MVRSEDEGSPFFWRVMDDMRQKKPEQIFVKDEHGRSLNFKFFHELTEKAAAGLSRIGVRPGSVVVWLLPNWIETLVLSAALDRLGAVQFPLSPSVDRGDLLNICDQQQAEVVVLPSVWKEVDYSPVAEELQRQLKDLWVLYLDKECLPSGLTLPEWRQEEGFKGQWFFCTEGENGLVQGQAQTIDDLYEIAEHFVSGLKASSNHCINLLFPFSQAVGVSLLLAAILADKECQLVE